MEDLSQEWARLQAVEREYGVTIRVLAVAVERLLALAGGDVVSITDQALAASPDLRAWRDPAAGAVLIAVSR